MFHNFSDCDLHLFIKEQGKKFNKDNIGVIAENKVKYISFNVKIKIKLAGVSNKDGKELHKNIQLRFMDSCRFMASGLDKLVSNLDDDQYKQLKEFYKGEGVLHLRGTKVYTHMSIQRAGKKIEETRLLPKNAFYSILNVKRISNQDYEHA